MPCDPIILWQCRSQMLDKLSASERLGLNEEGKGRLCVPS